MKQFIFLSFFLFTLSGQALAKSACFIVKENNKTMIEEGDCQTRFAPESTFKIPLSLIGFDSGILKSETRPEWPFKEGYQAFPETCVAPHNPRTWMRDSCVWYSQVLTQKLGMPKFKEYVTKFDYGNQDLTGGLTTAWLGSTLKISPVEQVEFIKKLTDNSLSVSTKSLQITQKILYREELSGGWQLYGKTGNGRNDQGIQHGWFVGWIEKDGRIIQFANHISDDKKEDSFASFRAREQAKDKLWRLIEEMHREL